MKTLGVCDSGIGGLLVLFSLHKAYPNMNMVFLADQSHVPYGNKSHDQLKEYAFDLMDEFKRRKIEDVVIACNTLCANVLDEIKPHYEDLHLYGIIEPTVAQLQSHSIQKVLVLATQKTVEKHAYRDAIHALMPFVHVMEVACPKLVPLIENGGSKEQLQKAVNEYIEGIEFDACILGCTHFPLIKDCILEQKDVLVFDSNQAIVDLLKDYDGQGEGKIEIYTTDDAMKLQQMIQRLFHENVLVKKILL